MIVSKLLQIRVYNVIDTSDCSNPVTRDELVHLFRGCTEDYCDNSDYYITVPELEPGATAAIPPTNTMTRSDTVPTTSTGFDYGIYQGPHSTIQEIPISTTPTISTVPIASTVLDYDTTQGTTQEISSDLISTSPTISMVPIASTALDYDTTQESHISTISTASVASTSDPPDHVKGKYLQLQLAIVDFNNHRS